MGKITSFMFKFLFVAFLATFNLNVFSQGTTCNSSDPFCTGTTATFPGGVNQPDASTTEPGNNYGCLTTSPNPAWYFMEIDQGGNLTIDINNDSGLDIDFALWGPFTDLTTAMGNCGALGSTADCSYSPVANETATITGANPGDVYILLVTNFDNNPTNISFTNTGGTATTNCAILSPCIITNLTSAPSACNPANNNYNVTGSISFTDPPINGTLTVTDCHGGTQVFNAPFASPINYSITGVNSDGVACNVTAVFSANTACTSTSNYNAPAACNPVCSMTGLTVNATACNPATGTYDVSGAVTFSDPPTTGTMTVTDCHGNNQIFNAPFASPINYAIAGINADGVACNVTAVFSADAACTFSLNYNAPASCNPSCSFTNLQVSVGTCNPNSTYGISGLVEFINQPTTGTLTITDGCSGLDTIVNAPFVSPLNWSISGLPTGSGTCDVTAVFSADPTCTISLGAANEYTKTAPCGCVANVGTFTGNIVGSGTTPYLLCFGDQFTMTSDGNNVDPDIANAPPIPAPGAYNPGLGYLIYSCPPTIGVVPSNVAPNDDITNDPCFIGVAGFGSNFNDINFLGGPSYAGAFNNSTI